MSRLECSTGDRICLDTREVSLKKLQSVITVFPHRDKAVIWAGIPKLPLFHNTPLEVLAIKSDASCLSW